MAKKKAMTTKVVIAWYCLVGLTETFFLLKKQELSDWVFFQQDFPNGYVCCFDRNFMFVRLT